MDDQQQEAERKSRLRELQKMRPLNMQDMIRDQRHESIVTYGLTNGTSNLSSDITYSKDARTHLKEKDEKKEKQEKDEDTETNGVVFILAKPQA